MTTLRNLFLPKKKLYFLTLKGEKYQTVGKVADLIRKVSKTFFVVREKNRKSAGYHFHALIEMEKEPHKSWFKKGVHMNLNRVGERVWYNAWGELCRDENKGSYLVPTDEWDSKALADYIENEPEEGLKFANDELFNKQLKLHRKKMEYLGHITRILTYMEKEQEFPAQYTDYICMRSGKHIVWNGKREEAELLKAGGVDSPRPEARGSPNPPAPMEGEVTAPPL